MTAIGAHIPRSARQPIPTPRTAVASTDAVLLDIRVDTSRAMVQLDQLQTQITAIGIRRRAAVARRLIFEQADASERRRQDRRAAARDRREAQRVVRIHNGTDRATLRAQRRHLDGLFPLPPRGWSRVLDRLFLRG